MRCYACRRERRGVAPVPAPPGRHDLSPWCQDCLAALVLHLYDRAPAETYTDAYNAALAHGRAHHDLLSLLQEGDPTHRDD